MRRERREYWVGKEVSLGPTNGENYWDREAVAVPPSSTAPEGWLRTLPCCSLLPGNLPMGVLKRRWALETIKTGPES